MKSTYFLSETSGNPQNSKKQGNNKNHRGKILTRSHQKNTYWEDGDLKKPRGKKIPYSWMKQKENREKEGGSEREKSVPISSLILSAR